MFVLHFYVYCDNKLNILGLGISWDILGVGQMKQDYSLFIKLLVVASNSLVPYLISSLVRIFYVLLMRKYKSVTNWMKTCNSESKENTAWQHILLFFPPLPQTLGTGQGCRHVVHHKGQGGRGGGRWGGARKGNMGLYSNPIPAGWAAAACAAFHNSGGFLGGEGGWAAFLHGRSHQRRRVTSKASQSLGVDDCNPPLGPLLAQPLSLLTHTHAHTYRVNWLRQVCTAPLLPRLSSHPAAALIIAH